MRGLGQVSHSLGGQVAHGPGGLDLMAHGLEVGSDKITPGPGVRSGQVAHGRGTGFSLPPLNRIKHMSEHITFPRTTSVVGEHLFG